MGNYNWLMQGLDKGLYDSDAETHESSHMLFRSAFPQGFPWEVLEVFTAPPRVSFSWRHWAEFSGVYRGNRGKGQLVEMFGFIIADVETCAQTGQLKICGLEVYFKPDVFLEALEGKVSMEKLQRYCSESDADQYKDFLSQSTPNSDRSGPSLCPFAAGRKGAAATGTPEPPLTDMAGLKLHSEDGEKGPPKARSGKKKVPTRSA
jgi:hypothetical protein